MLYFGKYHFFLIKCISKRAYLRHGIIGEYENNSLSIQKAKYSFKSIGSIQTQIHVRWVPCHHGMARSQVADGGKASRYGW
jgi:hypothetical protein